MATQARLHVMVCPLVYSPQDICYWERTLQKRGYPPESNDVFMVPSSSAQVQVSIVSSLVALALMYFKRQHVSLGEPIVAKEKIHSSWMHDSEPLNKPSFNHDQSNVQS
ncbi:hypothetical protein llap_9908 [Limosa lapponica baueri]|uniref:Uncharacterized protein n=1 Tax=Limosa lapponica baueri TaxID=1758121 RepID=A0A2I0U183_LIMLA|nr:hypothetical protein llap_9908 [Limosa lapponica baueri]